MLQIPVRHRVKANLVSQCLTYVQVYDGYSYRAVEMAVLLQHSNPFFSTGGIWQEAAEALQFPHSPVDFSLGNFGSAIVDGRYLLLSAMS